MEPGKSKWSLIESHVISFNKNDVQMELGRSKWSLGGSNGAWEVQMEPGRSKWMACILSCPWARLAIPRAKLSLTFGKL